MKQNWIGKALLGCVLVAGSASAQEIDYFMRPIAAPASDVASLQGLTTAREGIGLEARFAGGFVGAEDRTGLHLQVQQSFGTERTPFIGVTLSGAVRQRINTGTSAIDWGARGYFGLVPFSWQLSETMSLQTAAIGSFAIDGGFIPAVAAKAKLLSVGDLPWNVAIRLEPRVVDSFFALGAEISGGIGRQVGDNLFGVSLTASLDAAESATLRPFGAGFGADLTWQRSALTMSAGVTVPYATLAPNFGISAAFAL